MPGLQSMIVLAAILMAPEATATAGGQLMATVGDVQLERHGQRLRGVAGMPLLTGDRLATAAGSRTAVFFADGTSVYLGPDAAATFREGNGERSLLLERGEARATVGGARGLVLSERGLEVRVARGIVRAVSAPRGVRVWAEHGPAVLSRGDGPGQCLEEGGEVFLAPGQEEATVEPASGRGWSIRTDEILLAGAIAVSEQLQGRDVPAGEDPARTPAIAPRTTPAQPEPPPRRRPGQRAAPEAPPRPGVPDTTRAAPEAPPPGAADATRATPEAPVVPTPGDQPANQPIAVSQPTTAVGSSSVSLALGAISGSSSLGGSGAIFSDAQQDSLNPLFPGNIHIVAAQATYTLQDVSLRASDGFPSARQYWSIGLGRSPTSQVLTTFNTGSDPTPVSIRIPHTSAYLVQFPLADYGIPDPADPRSRAKFTSGISGLVGAVPVAPQVRGATPLTDPRAIINNRATFAVGELSLMRQGDHPQIEVRRSDQDRQIIPSPLGSTFDKVTPNPDVSFVRVIDNKFFPEFPQGVEVPTLLNPLNDPPTYGKLNTLRRAAVTTLIADSLFGYARRTGQTRFILKDPNGHQSIVDITGYRRLGANATLQAANRAAERTQRTALMHSGFNSGRFEPGGAHARHHH